MPFYCGKRSAGICVVSTQNIPLRIPVNTLPVFYPAVRICQRLLHLATKDYSDRLLANGIHRTYGYGWGDGSAVMPMLTMMTILAEDTDEA